MKPIILTKAEIVSDGAGSSRIAQVQQSQSVGPWLTR